MKATSESSSNLGSPISMRDVLIRVWDQGYQILHFRRSRFRPDGITFRITIACRQFPYSAAFTTNINWKKSRLEKFRMSYLRSTSIGTSTVFKHMDRKSVSFSATYPSVRLYQDDLAYIFHVLSQSKDIQISDQEFKYQSLDEVEKQRGKTFGSLYIHASEPTSMIELSNKKHSSNRVFSEDPGIFHLLDDLLTSSTLPIVRWFIKLEWLIWVAVLAIFIGVAVVVFKAGSLGLLFLPLLGLAG